MILETTMRFNELAIENAVLETETVQSFRRLQKQNRLDEVVFLVPWVIAAAKAILQTVVIGSATWLTEQTVGNFIDYWRRSNFVPNANFIPEGMELTVNDSRTNTRYSYKYENKQWKRPVLAVGRDGSMRPTGRWTPVPSSVDMKEVIEATARQRRWYDRLLGRRLRGIGFDWSNVSEDEMRKSIALTSMANRPDYIGSSADDINTAYERETATNAARAEAASEEYNRRIRSASKIGLIVDVCSILGIAGWLYQCNELMIIYEEQLTNEEITVAQYQEKVETLKNSMKTLITATVSNVATAALAAAVSTLFLAKLPRIRKMGVWAIGLTTAAITGAVAVAAFRANFKSMFISWLDDVWFVDTAEGVDAVIDSYLDDLLSLLGIEDIITRQGRERDEAQTVGIDLNAPPAGGKVDVGNIFNRNN